MAKEYPLFPKAIRLVLYAGVAIAGLASVPAVISHVRSATAPLMDDDAAATDAGGAGTAAHKKKSQGTILIEPAGRDSAVRRKAELAALEAKLAATPK